MQVLVLRGQRLQAVAEAPRLLLGPPQLITVDLALVGGGAETHIQLFLTGINGNSLTERSQWKVAEVKF